eukprot:CAMPEP_0204185504 /NCGR_PEP_ID=MMETSP0361-20130328/55369_1 /ASSEMBLY_ACC=CAM_ASM_000343 /TAXON_ID=268821 /ORGANISM="Scrippsiella Hangoei, Strain SHTV-5" /LENGTH=51 /DNA_ID=CAMNT_0051145695 /DNA_START=1 /DNA_END=153 /DNA_ORIENTATION=+
MAAFFFIAFFMTIGCVDSPNRSFTWIASRICGDGFHAPDRHEEGNEEKGGH